ncbi:MAG: glycosyl transferase family 1 [Sulfobacillus benefaciens]|uniref:Glycosyl transferase family 1 n=1 Tax=Sulfobacillus benefaciens TaxID=453960 RepID=A0A2T2XBE1_9FIRM|nr:MAG: glycosyl transferase family 1 [Sulfobacillus benefaciens]HBQ94218.1 glycosyl transferase family 1 [Sulfobacillus sp.]
MRFADTNEKFGSEGTIANRVLRITFLLPGPPSVPVGGYRVVYTYANRLAQRGHRVNVVHAGKLGQFEPPEPTAWKTLRKAYRYWSRLKPAIFPPRVSWHTFHPRVKLVFLKGEPINRVMPSSDVVVATAWTTAEYLQHYSQDKGERFYLIQHLETWQGKEARALATWQLPFHKIVVSRWLYTQGMERGLDDMIHIPIAVDHEIFHPGNTLGLRNISILGMYNPAPWKGGRDLIAVMGQLRDLYPAVPILLFGVTERPPDLPLSIDYVQNPAQKTLADFYRTYAIFVHTSYLEGWALPPAEAMASGCLFVGTDSRGNRDYAVPEVNSVLVEPGDTEGLVKRVAHVMEDTVLQQRLQEEGLRTLAKFHWENSTDALERYFLRYQD